MGWKENSDILPRNEHLPSPLYGGGRVEAREAAPPPHPPPVREGEKPARRHSRAGGNPGKKKTWREE